MNTQRIISKHALILIARGNKEIASQIYVYDHMREIRVDLEALEVKVLMDYDESYHRVFKIEPNEKLNENDARKIVVEFYNNLLNSSMKLTKEEINNISAQRKANIEKNKKYLKKEND